MVFESFVNAGIILENYDRDSVLKVLWEEVPGLTVNSMTFVSEGWSNLVVDVNDEWIFRFPREEKFLPILEREGLLLNRLRNHISLSIPYYEFTGSKTVFVGYRKILGEALHKNLYATLPEDARQGIAETLAIFLTQMHQAISLNEARSLGYEECKIPIQSSFIKDKKKWGFPFRRGSFAIPHHDFEKIAKSMGVRYFNE